MCNRHERVFLLALQKLFFRYPLIARTLLDDCGSAQKVFQDKRHKLRPHFGRYDDLWQRFLEFDDWKNIEESLRTAQRLGAKIIGLKDPSYPSILRQIHDPPPVIIAIGKGIDALGAPAVAIVGARKASQHGLNTAASIAEGLASRGVVVVSGMAHGIDASAHRGAISARGSTIAVFGCGPDIIYPPWHKNLATQIMDSGLLVSEFPPGEEPFKSNFPQRNRIISGLSIATVIVEARDRSGSLITARFALEQNREVFAVPGPAGTQLACGTNRLIRQGAALIESADDVIEILKPLVNKGAFSEKSGHFKNDTDMESQLLSLLPCRGSKGIDEIVLETKISVHELLGMLTKLSMQGKVKELPGCRWKIKENNG
ncbi:MAG: DNA-processing protein DprA [Pseudomonadota bacterium]